MDRATTAAIRWSRQRVDGDAGWRAEFERRLFDRLVYRRLRAVFGGRLRFAFCGGAPLSEPLAAFFDGCGIPIYEGYGMTETSPIVTMSGVSAWRPGTVGRAVDATSIRIAEDHEVLVKGPQVFGGYWRHTAATAECIDSDGWFHTGDLGSIDAEGFLTITGRATDMIVTAGGESISPAVVESELRVHPLISQVVLVGDGRPFITALITLDDDGVSDWMVERRIPPVAKSTITTDRRLTKAVQEIIDNVNATAASPESIRSFRVLSDDFSTEQDEVTPTAKVRRSAVAERYRSEIDEMYAT